MNPISIFCFVTLISFCFNRIPRVESDAALITQTCAKALYKDLCERTLRADPGSNAANVQGLAKIALEAAASKAKNIQIKAADLFKKSPQKGALKDCSENYASAVEQLDNSLGALYATHYSDVKTWVTAAMTNANSCEQGFKSGSPLTQANINFNHLCNNVLAIANQLA